MQDVAENTWDPFARGCPSRDVLTKIGDRWTVLVINALAQGPLRYSELHHRVDGISQKMLSQTLKGLVHDGLATRQVYPEIPPRVEYELTAAGLSLLEPLQMLVNWAIAHMDDIVAARKRAEK